MEVKIGVQYAARELVLESAQTPDEVAKAVSEALQGRPRRPRARRREGPPGAGAGRQARLRRDRRERAAPGGLRRDVARAPRAARQAVEADRRHPRGVLVGEPVEQPDDAGQVALPTSSSVSASRSTATRCAWMSASPTRRRPHRASRPATAGSAAMAPVDPGRPRTPPGRCRRAPRAPAPGLRVLQRARDLAVEVGREAVADVRLDQALEPVVGLGGVVEGVQRRTNGSIAASGSHAGPAQVVAQLAGSGRTPRPPSSRARPCRRRSARAGRRWPAARTRSARRTRARRAGRRSRRPRAAATRPPPARSSAGGRPRAPRSRDDSG